MATEPKHGYPQEPTDDELLEQLRIEKERKAAGELAERILAGVKERTITTAEDILDIDTHFREELIREEPTEPNGSYFPLESVPSLIRIEGKKAEVYSRNFNRPQEDLIRRQEAAAMAASLTETAIISKHGT